MKQVIALSLLLTAVLLSGCADRASWQRLHAMDTTSLSSVDNGTLCDALKDFPNEVSQAMAIERSRRNLGDCSKEHQKCASYGLAPGMPGYAECRLRLDQEERAKDRAFVQSLQDYNRQQAETNRQFQQDLQNNWNQSQQRYEERRMWEQSRRPVTTNCVRNIFGGLNCTSQ